MDEMKKDVFNPSPITSLYKIGPFIGHKGGFAQVRKIIDRSTLERRAVKIIPKHSPVLRDASEESSMMSVHREIRIMKGMRGVHKGIINYVDAFEDYERYYLVMDYCGGGDLHERTKKNGGRVSEETAAGIVKQLVDVVKTLHDNGIAHCDIKPSNVLFMSSSNSSLRLIDFGLSQLMYNPVTGDSALSGVKGTLPFAAPEVFYGNYTELVDIWSIGVLTFVIIFGYNPFDPIGTSDENMIEANILKGFKATTDSGYGAFFPEGFQVSEEAKDFISLLLTKDVSLRPRTDEILEHPWLSNVKVSS